MLQSWWKLVERKVKVPAFTFSKTKSALAPYINVESDEFLLSKAWNFANNHDLREKVFYCIKSTFYFVSAILSKIVGYWYFQKIPLQLAEWYWNASWCFVYSISNRFQVINWFLLINNALIQHSNMVLSKP